MNGSEILKGVPPRLIAAERYLPFTETMRVHASLRGVKVSGDATNLSTAKVSRMPVDTVASFTTEVDGKAYPMQLVKGESIPYIVSVRLVSGMDPRYMFEAHLRRPGSFIATMREYGAPFATDLPSRTLAVSFDIKAKINGQHHPPMRARLFLPWAMQVLKPYNPTHVLAEWEPDSDNHQAYYEAFALSNDPMQAVEATWTHRQYSQLGFNLMEGISIVGVRESTHGLVTKVSPHGYPPTVIRALYKI